MNVEDLELTEAKKIDADVDIAYDRKQQRYVAYNTGTGLFGTGICVESAREAYVNAYYEREAVHGRDYLEEGI